MSYPQDRFTSVELRTGSFWDQWRSVARNVSAPTQLAMLKETGRYQAFDLKWQEYYKKPMDVWPVPQHLFWESDVAKFIEAASYLLREKHDEALQQAVDHMIGLIESAQQPDGYLNIHFVVCEPEKRFSNLRDLHELYNAGHLIEAAVAHHAYAGSDRLVNVMMRFVRYIATVFGTKPGQLQGYPGHPEIELALLRLYDVTKEQVCLDMARYFVLQRGANEGEYYRSEQAKRGEHPQLAPAMMPKAHSYWYMQAHAPLVEQKTIEGHAVRAMYLLTAAADLCLIDKDEKKLHTAVERLWRDCCARKTCVTGGIGTIHQWEGFGAPYVLSHSKDQGGSYNETCASIGQLMLADRLQLLNGLDGARVTDVAERALYNASITTGMSIDGRAFTYDNALASSPDNPCTRHTWFECACCPPNVLRTLAALAGYFWSSIDAKSIAVHHYFDGTLKSSSGQPMVTMQTEYPWSGVVQIAIAENVEECKEVYVRIPQWALQDATIAVGSASPSSPNDVTKGYVKLTPGRYTIDLHIKPRLIYSHPYTNHSTLTVAYGPLIYCLEDVDNSFESDHFRNLTIHASIGLEASKSDKHDGVVVIRAKGAGRQLELKNDEYALAELAEEATLGKERLDLLFVPYYYRANRTGGKGQMRCPIRRRFVE